MLPSHRQLVFCAAFATLLIVTDCGSSLPKVNGEDWPAWRRDSNRSANTSEQLASELYLQWSLELPKLKPAWTEDPRLQFDATYEPVVSGNTLFYGSSKNDSVTAVDYATGAKKWQFFAEGPVRFAPLVVADHVYFAADDGCLYCVMAENGELVWQFRAAPNKRRVLGNDRLISVWPVRGGPVLLDGQIHFTAGVWPFEGTFLYAVDATTGELVESRPVEAADVASRPAPKHNVLTLNNMTPQGYLAATESNLFIPQGRSIVGSRNRSTGGFESYRYSTSGVTDYHVCATGQWLFHGAVTYDTTGKRQLGMSLRTPVLDSEKIYAGENGKVVAYSLTDTKEIERTDRRGKKSKVTLLTESWSINNDQILDVPKPDQYVEWLKANPLAVDVKAGNRLYGHQGNLVFALDLPADEKPAVVSWSTEVVGTPASLLVANGRLVVTTKEGAIHCFGAEKGSPIVHTEELQPVVAADSWTDRVAALVEHADAADSFCVVAGIESGGLISELLRQSELRLIVVDPDADRVDELRRQYDQTGMYGGRIVAHVGNPASFELPQYMATVLVSENPQAYGLTDKSEELQRLYSVLRPYGGTAYLPMTDEQHSAFEQRVAGTKLVNAEVVRVGQHTLLSRVGALEGSADWTHEYGDASNTLMSRDGLVKAPLGVLWFGGPSSDGSLFYNRHFWGPSMAVIGGRMFIQGPGKMTAVDVYTGRILWQIPLKDDDDYRAGRRGNDFEKHLSGFHFLVIEDSIYLVHEKSCLRLDPATGKQLAEFKLPNAEDDWGRIRVKDDMLIAVVFRTLDADKEKLPDARKLLAGQRSPVEVRAMNRLTGEKIWSHEADASFPVVSVGKDKIFCFDGALESFYQDWKRRGLIPKASDVRYLKAIDLKTGELEWSEYADIIGTWVSYSEEHDVLLLTNKKHVMAFRGETGALLWKQYAEGEGFKGHPESLWDRVIIWNDRVLDQRGPGLSWDLETGEPIAKRHPITNKNVDWEFTKAGHHCNYAIASPHMMTFRADTAGFCDIETGETSRLNGFRSGCRNSLIPANGVLNAPNFAHGCVCGYSLFTSLSLVHLPDSELWSYSALSLNPKEDQVQRIGVNFGAPGDRMANNGTMWFDVPNIGGSSPSVPVETKGDNVRNFRQHSSLIEGDGTAWVAGSGIEGATSIAIGLGKQKEKATGYTVRLHFSEPDAIADGERVFDVALQGDTVVEKLDVVKEAAGRNRSMVREFRNVQAAGSIRIELTPVHGRTLLCGVEVVADVAVAAAE